MKIRRNERGTGLVEVMVSIGAIVVSIGGLSMSVISTQKASSEMRNRDLVRAQALKFMERMIAMPYGGPGDTFNSSAFQNLMDDNPQTLGTGLTLMGCWTTPGGNGREFHIDGFEAGGVWELEVNSDLDASGDANGYRGNQAPTTGIAAEIAGSGVVSGTMTTLRSETHGTATPLPAPVGAWRGDIVRIELFWNGRSVAKTFRSNLE